MVTMYVATLDLTKVMFSYLIYATLGGYFLGLLGMVIAFMKMGTVGKFLVALAIGLSTGAVGVMVSLSML